MNSNTLIFWFKFTYISFQVFQSGIGLFFQVMLIARASDNEYSKIIHPLPL